MKRSLFTGFVFACLAVPASSADPPIDFGRDVRPILTAACMSCHGPAKQRGGLRLDNGAAALRGGDRGPAFKPGDAAHSRLLLAVAGWTPTSRCRRPASRR